VAVDEVDALNPPIIMSLAFDVLTVTDGVVLVPVAVAGRPALASNGVDVFAPEIPKIAIEAKSPENAAEMVTAESAEEAIA
jgi:hypothetical protein